MKTILPMDSWVGSSMAKTRAPSVSGDGTARRGISVELRGPLISLDKGPREWLIAVKRKPAGKNSNPLSGLFRRAYVAISVGTQFHQLPTGTPGSI